MQKGYILIERLKMIVAPILVVAMIGGFFVFRENLQKQTQQEQAALEERLNALAENAEAGATDGSGGTVSREQIRQMTGEWMESLKPKDDNSFLGRLVNFCSDTWQMLGGMLEKMGISLDPADWMQGIKDFVNGGKK